ncbi:MAG: DUF2490 domain-containing protein [Chitinophagales bacterium]|nr:DUF2490 domain-containing protein [Bacteroidota bacterium]
MLRKWIPLIFCLWFSDILTAQEHDNLWLRATVSAAISKNIKMDNELQHRRQNGWNNHNLLDENLLYSYRNWLHYKHSEGLSFSLSPFAYFSNYKIVQTEADEGQKPKGEFRFSAAVEFQQSLVGKFHLFDRTALEYRIFPKNHKEVTRFRNRLGAKYVLNEQLSFSASEEVLLNISGADISHFFDQNRLTLSATYKLSAHFKIDLSYMYLTRLSSSGDSTMGENDVLVYFTYSL